MLIVPLDVKCVVCKKIFCCVQCRRKHEATEHISVLAVEKVKNCDLCKGTPLVAIDLNQNDAFVRHLCEKHLPLRCKKCSEVWICHIYIFYLLNCYYALFDSQFTDHQIGVRPETHDHDEMHEIIVGRNSKSRNNRRQ